MSQTVTTDLSVHHYLDTEYKVLGSSQNQASANSEHQPSKESGLGTPGQEIGQENTHAASIKSTQPSIPRERAQGSNSVGLHQPDETVDTAKVPGWGVGWKTPALMFGLYLAALLIAILHLLFFLTMNGKPASGDHSLPQSYVSVASQVLTKLFNWTLCMSLDVAFTQHLWHVFRAKSIKISDIELLYGIRNNAFSIARPGPVKHAPFLVILALVGWLVSIAVTYPPGALTVRPISTVSPVNTTVVYFNASDRSNGNVFSSDSGPALEALVGTNDDGPFNFVYSSDSSLPSEARPTLLLGNTLKIPSPCGQNCTFNITFDGPYLKCDINVTHQSSLDVIQVLDQINKSYTVAGDLLALSYSAQWIGSPSPREGLPGNFALSIAHPGWVEYDKNGQIIGISYQTQQTNCIPYRATYDLKFQYSQGQGNLSRSLRPVQALKDMWNSTANVAQSGYFRNYSSEGVWEASAADRYLAINIFSLIDEFANVLLGTVPSNWKAQTNPPLTPYNISSGPGPETPAGNNSSFPNLTIPGPILVVPPSSTTVYYDAYMMDQSDQLADQFWNSSVMSTIFNPYQFNYTSSNEWINLTMTETMINEALANVTFNTMAALQQWNTVITADIGEISTVYSFSAPKNLIIPYFLSLAVAIPFLVVGTRSLYQNGVSAIDGGFIQVLTTTYGSKTLERLAATGCLGGDENASEELLALRVRFGEMIERDGNSSDGNRIRKAGFGTDDEIVPLSRNARYGAKSEAL